MSLVMTYKNDFGTLTMQSTAKGEVRICAIEGLGVASSDYTAAVYTGQNGQNTISERLLPRCITLLLEVTGDDIQKRLRDILEILSHKGTLFVEDEHISRRIRCDQVQISEIKRIVKGRLFTIAVQFVCDSPYFEDSKDTVLPLYERGKCLMTPFTLPCVFGEIIVGGQIENEGDMEIEPQITMHFPSAIDAEVEITILNETTGKKICLNYLPLEKDVVVIDVKNRSVESLIAGNILNSVSMDTFLGDFVLKRGINQISVTCNDVAPGFYIEVRYSNYYREAVIA